MPVIERFYFKKACSKEGTAQYKFLILSYICIERCYNVRQSWRSNCFRGTSSLQISWCIHETVKNVVAAGSRAFQDNIDIIFISYLAFSPLIVCSVEKRKPFSPHCKGAISFAKQLIAQVALDCRSYTHKITIDRVRFSFGYGLNHHTLIQHEVKGDLTAVSRTGQDYQGCLLIPPEESLWSPQNLSLPHLQTECSDHLDRAMRHMQYA